MPKITSLIHKCCINVDLGSSCSDLMEVYIHMTKKMQYNHV